MERNNSTESSAGDLNLVDTIIVGAGFAGLYALHKMRENGFSTQVIEAGSGVGGTWFWIRYPDARCDVESMQYSYSFSPELEQEWNWTEHYATQPEILRYAEHIAERFGLLKDIRFNTRVVAVNFDDARHLWIVRTSQGDTILCRNCITATGCLSSQRKPDIPGVNSFEGSWYHAASWPHEAVDFTGLWVGVIGTGSTAIQIIPQIAMQANHLFVFQRTANYSLPARNRLLEDADRARFKTQYADIRA